MQYTRTRNMVGIAMIGAIAFVISIFEFPIIPGLPFLKIDLSDIPIFFATFIFGPAGAIGTSFIRSALQYVRTGGDGGFPIGATASFIASISLVLPIYSVTTKLKASWLTKVFAICLATFSLTLILTIVNWLFVLPAYMAVLNFPINSIQAYLVTALIPFNLIKGGLVSTLIMILFTRLEPWLKKMRFRVRKSQKDHDKVNFQS